MIATWHVAHGTWHIIMEGTLAVYCWLPVRASPPISADSPSGAQTVYAFVNDSWIKGQHLHVFSLLPNTDTVIVSSQALAAAVEL